MSEEVSPEQRLLGQVVAPGLPRTCPARRELVLVTEKQVYRIHHQRRPDLAAFANRRVKVEGTWAGDRIVVASVAALR